MKEVAQDILDGRLNFSRADGGIEVVRMTELTREDRLLQTFASLADTLVDDYDVVDLLQMLVDTCRDLLDTTAAAILLADATGELDVVASTSEASRLVEVIQLSAEAGPCVESFLTGRVGVRSRRRASPEDGPGSGRRPRPGVRLGARGAASAARDDDRHAQPAPRHRRRARVARPDRCTGVRGCRDDRHPARAVAARDRRAGGTAPGALNSRIVIEQAKGVVAFTRGVPIDEAFKLIRAYARSHQLGISQVAARIVDRSLRLEQHYLIETPHQPDWLDQLTLSRSRHPPALGGISPVTSGGHCIGPGGPRS